MIIVLRARRSEVDTATCESEAWDEVRHDMTRQDMRLKGSRFTHQQEEGCFFSDREKGRRRSPPFSVSLRSHSLVLLFHHLRRTIGVPMLQIVEKAASLIPTGGRAIGSSVSSVHVINQRLPFRLKLRPTFDHLMIERWIYRG